MKKLKNLTHYILSKVDGCDEATLNKILWAIDTASYLKTGKSVTEATYIKGQDCNYPTDKIDQGKAAS